MIKLQDFATRQGVTDRQIQRLLNKYAAELEGLYQRKGPGGTWLTDEACEILRSKMKQQPVVVYDDRVTALEAENKELRNKLITAYESMTKIQNRQLELTGQLEEQRLLAAGAKESEERAAKAAADLEQAKGTIEAIRREAKMRCDEAQAAEERAARAEEAAKTAEDIAQCAAQEADRAKAEMAELQKKIETLKKRSLWSRIWNREE